MRRPPSERPAASSSRCHSVQGRVVASTRFMTSAELILIAAAAIGLYLLMRPIQRRLERYLSVHVFGRYQRNAPHIIDVTHFRSTDSDSDDHDTKDE